MVMPIYYKSKDAVDKLSPEDVKEMSLVKDPCESTKIVAQALCYFLIEDGLNET